MTALRKRLKVGDIMEVSTPRGLSYIQYVGKHEDYSDVIYVIKGFHDNRPQHFDDFYSNPGYITFYPAKHAVKTGFVEIVFSGNLPEGIDVPTHLRRNGAIDSSGKTLNWIIEKDNEEFLKEVLTESDKKIPIVGIWNHEFLIDSIVEEWVPEQEG